MKPIHYVVAALILAAPNARAASLADAESPLICAVVDVASCEPGTGCRRETADSVNLPQLVTVNRKAQEVTGRQAANAALM